MLFSTASLSVTTRGQLSAKNLSWASKSNVASPRSTQSRTRTCTVTRATSGPSGEVKKVVLAYSGGLDTSIILKWLQDTYNCEVVTFTADLGQGEELEPARKKAEQFGVKEIFIDDLKEEFVRDYVFPMFRANAVYEGTYLLGTSIARPLIAKRQIEIAKLVGADAVCHGATGKGNDQVRFELGYYGMKPDVKVIAPWREWDLNSRTKLLAYADKHGIPVAQSKRQDAPYSTDANLLHISYEGNALEDPWIEYSEDMFTRSVSPEKAPDTPTYIEVEFEKGDPVAIDGKRYSPAEMLTKLNQLGGDNGIGRLDIVESRFVGMKSRGVYETPGGTILFSIRRALETICLDRGEMHYKDQMMPQYAELIYNGFWFSPEREMMQSAIDKCSESVTGTVRAKLYKGNVIVVGRKAANSLYDDKLSTFEEDGGAYNQKDAGGFIKLQALRLRTLKLARGN
jgi:argininosuccinate synthase